MDIRIGIANVARELSVEIDDDEADAFTAEIEQAVAGKSTLLWVTDKSGRRVAVPVGALAYVEMGPSGERRVGFGN